MTMPGDYGVQLQVERRITTWFAGSDGLDRSAHEDAANDAGIATVVVFVYRMRSNCKRARPATADRDWIEQLVI